MSGDNYRTLLVTIWSVSLAIPLMLVAINDENIYILRLAVIYDDLVHLKSSDRYFIEIIVSSWKEEDQCLVKDNQLCLKFFVAR